MDAGSPQRAGTKVARSNRAAGGARIGAKRLRHAVINEAVPRDAREAPEPLGDDAHAEMTPFARAGMPGVVCALILDGKPDGRKPSLERGLDALSACESSRRAHRRSQSCAICSRPAAATAAGAARRASQNTCTKMNAAVARVSPKTLKSTHVRSLA